MDLSNLSIPEGLSETVKPMVTCTIEGIIDEDDLRELALTSTSDVQVQAEDPGDLKKLREKHHHVARLVADGLTQRMVAQICGYSESYVSILLNNPAMKELVELYRIQSGAAVKVATEKLKTVGLAAVEKLAEKIDRDELNATELTSVAKLGLDRGGLGPASKQHVVNEQHVIDHARLKELDAEARRRNSEFIVPVSEVRGAIEATARQLPKPQAEGDSDAAD